MPPRKRPATQATAPTAIPSVRPNKRARRPRLRPEEAPTVHESTTTEQANVIASNPSSSSPGTVSVDVDAITATISAVITQAVKTAFSPEKLASLLDNNSPTPVVTQAPTGLVEQAVDDDVHVITNPQSGIEAVDPLDLVNSGPYDQRPQVQFTSVSVPLTSRVSSKIKAKIWSNEYINFGSLLSDSPQQEGKYSLSMTPSVAGSSSQPQLTLEPCHVSKKIANISQWVSAFNIFVSVYAERFNNYTPQLMKYCEVVRDLAAKGGDWHWYDEQFRYVRQSAPEQYPWDRIHWELWLRASNTFRKPQPPTNKPRFRSQFFPKGTCWAFQAGKHCSGCKFEHVCFKCGGKHPGGQCSASAPKSGFPFSSKGKRDSTSGSPQQASHASKSGSA